MNILLLGYGKMGQTIEKIAIERGHTISGIIDHKDQDKSSFNAQNTDVAIEFSQPDAAVQNIHWCISNNIPVISGTTGWLEKYDEIADATAAHHGTFFYASNYSLGVNIFFRLNKYLAKMMGHTSGYEVSISETHHIQKKDSPSGTAITLAEGIIDALPHKTTWKEDNPAPDTVSIQSLREPNVPGTHVINYESAEDSIQITHTAHSRKGFALGAVLVAEWLPQHQGVLGMDDFLEF
jgi:4-hydroxy-tetrahydrodipicolinate reductase